MYDFLSNLVLTLTLLSALALLQPAAKSQQPPCDSDKAERAKQSDHAMCASPTSPATTKHAYHPKPPTGPLPPTLDPSQFGGNKVAFVAYSIAARIPALLYQEPCTCGCDRDAGHGSLLDCFTGRHGEHCYACQLEIFFCFEQYKSGSTASQIREGLERGDYLKLDREKYAQAHYPDYQPAPR